MSGAGSVTGAASGGRVNSGFWGWHRASCPLFRPCPACLWDTHGRTGRCHPQSVLLPGPSCLVLRAPGPETWAGTELALPQKLQEDWKDTETGHRQPGKVGSQACKLPLVREGHRQCGDGEVPGQLLIKSRSGNVQRRWDRQELGMGGLTGRNALSPQPSVTLGSAAVAPGAAPGLAPSLLTLLACRVWAAPGLFCGSGPSWPLAAVTSPGNMVWCKVSVGQVNIIPSWAPHRPVCCCGGGCGRFQQIPCQSLASCSAVPAPQLG